MSSIGPYYPLTCTDNNYDGYGLTWSSPGGATTVGGASASVSVNTAGSTGSDTHYLKASNFGFSVPSSTINGVYRDWETDRKSTRLNSSDRSLSRMPSSA